MELKLWDNILDFSAQAIVTSQRWRIQKRNGGGGGEKFKFYGLGIFDSKNYILKQHEL